MRKVRAVILCEDRAHWHFAPAYLATRGWNTRQLPPRIAPAGAGSGEQWVREKFAQEVMAGENLCLIAMIDGDKRPDERIAKLESSVAGSGLEPRKPQERIAVIVPNRNLESWFAWLDGAFRHEEPDEKPKYRKGASRRDFGRRLADYCVQGIDPSKPRAPSLQRARNGDEFDKPLQPLPASPASPAIKIYRKGREGKTQRAQRYFTDCGRGLVICLPRRYTGLKPG